ncbi:MAG: S8 family serine peptidase [Polyangia bacterium]
MHIAVLLAVWLHAPIGGSDSAGGAARQRFVVELSVPSLVAASRAGSFELNRDRGGRPVAASSAARAHLRALERQQERFRRALSVTAPDAQIQWSYRLLYNGATVAGAPARLLESLPGVEEVHVTDDVVFEPSLDASLPLVEAEGLWEAAGGQEQAGVGTRIAVIDSGIDPDHPFFDPGGFGYPDGFPLGATEHTSEKVIAARAYFRSGDPVDVQRDEGNPRDHIGHGTHCAGIAAGNAGTVAIYEDAELELSGVAPAAQLMIYKVFYLAESGGEGAYEPELIAAFEDAVADGADVISCSWGSPDRLVDGAASAEVYQAAIDAGAVVVFAAGNDGDGPGTISYPASLPRVLSVGSFDTGRYFAGRAEVVAPEPVPPALVGMPAVSGAISPEFDIVGPLPLVPAASVQDGANTDGCDSFPWSVFDGAAALIARGACLFSQKANHAYLAGAEAVVIYNDEAGEGPIVMGGEPVEIPAVQLGNEDGLALEKHALENETVEVLFDGSSEAYEQAANVGRVSEFSARGPTDAPRLDPDILAPGSSILSSNAWPFDEQGRQWELRQGTSMAAPHVSGAAAAIRSLRPDSSADQLRALLVGAADRQAQGLSGTTPLDVGAGALDLAAAAIADACAEPPVLSLGKGLPGEAFAASLRLKGEGSAAYEVEWIPVHPGCEPVEPLSGTQILPGEEVTVEIECASDAVPGEHSGWIDLVSGGRRVTVPYHVRLLPERDRELLLLDASFRDLEHTSLVEIYTDLAEQAGLDWELLRLEVDGAAPDLAELNRFETVLVLTGNDQTIHEERTALSTLDALSIYAHEGGNVLLCGQGPLRGTDHPRIAGLLGSRIHQGFPLFDQYTLGLVELDDYLARPVEGTDLIEAPLDLAPTAGGEGDLMLLGELITVAGPGLPEPWTVPFLEMHPAEQFALGGTVGALFDPYLGYGVHPGAEQLEHRAAVLGFGLERVGQSAGTLSRQELFETLFEWLTARIDLELDVEQEGLHVRVDAETAGSEAVEHVFDWGDGSDPVSSDYHVGYYEYSEPGTYLATVLARGPSGEADVERVELEVQEESDDPEPQDTDSETLHAPAGESVPPRTRDCACRSPGGGQRGSSLFRELIEMLRPIQIHPLGLYGSN